MMAGEKLLIVLFVAMLGVSGCSNKPLSVPPQKQERINPIHKIQHEKLTTQKDEQLDAMRREALSSLECDFAEMDQKHVVGRSKRITDNPRFSRVVSDYKAYK